MTPEMTDFDLLELQGYLRSIGQAGSFTDDESLRKLREDLLDAYMSRPLPGDGSEAMANRSKVVTAEVASTVEFLRARLTAIIMGKGRPAEFRPSSEEDEEAADIETEAVERVIMDECDGFSVLETAIHETLLQPNSYVKVYWDDAWTCDYEQLGKTNVAELLDYLEQLEYDGATADVMTDDPEDERIIKGVLKVWKAGGDLDIDQAVTPLDAISIKIRRRQSRPRIECVPPEQVGLPRDWPHVSLESVPYLWHRREDVTRADLIAAGWDVEQVMGLPESSRNRDAERLNRTGVSDQRRNSANDPLGEYVEVTEFYIRRDLDGDDIQEMYKVTTGSDAYTILYDKAGDPGVEQIPCMPFISAVSHRMPHQHRGYCAAEKAQPFQRMSTNILRLTLDNVHFSMIPRVQVSENALMSDGQTLHLLHNPSPGQAIVTAGNGTINPLVAPPMIAPLIAVSERTDRMRETALSVSALDQGVANPGGVNHTATGIDLVMSTAQQPLLLQAETIVDTLIKPMWRKVHALLRRYGAGELAWRRRGQWQSTDPRTWPERVAVTANIGLGRGARNEQLQSRMAIHQMQMAQLAAGNPFGLIQPENLYENLLEIGERMGIQAPGHIATEPEKAAQILEKQAQNAPPDPTAEALKAQIEIERMKAQLAQQKAGLDARLKIADLQLRRNVEEAKDDRERDKAESDVVLRGYELGSALAIQEAQAEMSKPREGLNDAA